jgi:hypothetical protein
MPTPVSMTSIVTKPSCACARTVIDPVAGYDESRSTADCGTPVQTRGIGRDVRAKMFQRMKGDFPTLGSPEYSRRLTNTFNSRHPQRDGGVGTCSFDSEEKAPYVISTIGIDVRGPDGGTSLNRSAQRDGCGGLEPIDRW